jgi:hypothetical protein
LNTAPIQHDPDDVALLDAARAQAAGDLGHPVGELGI